MTEDAATGVLNTEGVSGIVNYPQVIVVGNFLNGLYVTWVAVAVHRHDSGGLRCDCRFDFGWVEIEGLRVNIHKNGLNAVPQK
ncbi:hypothetical protein D3C84_1045620 [compost metagenome]